MHPAQRPRSGARSVRRATSTPEADFGPAGGSGQLQMGQCSQRVASELRPARRWRLQVDAPNPAMFTARLGVAAGDGSLALQYGRGAVV